MVRVVDGVVVSDGIGSVFDGTVVVVAVVDGGGTVSVVGALLFLMGLAVFLMGLLLLLSLMMVKLAVFMIGILLSMVMYVVVVCSC